MEPIVFRYRGRDVCAVDIAFVRTTIAAHYAAGRSYIAQVLCERWAWRQPNGAYKRLGALDLLLRLEAAGYKYMAHNRIYAKHRVPAAVIAKMTPERQQLLRLPWTEG